MPYVPSIPGLQQNTGPYTALPGFTTPTFGTAGAGYGQENVISTLFDRNPFAILSDVYYRHVKVSDFRLFLKAMGMSRGVDAPTTGHYETDFDNGLVKLSVINTAPGGAGQNMVATLHTDSMFNANATIGGVAAQSSEVQPGDILMSPTSRKQAQVVAKDVSFTPHRITLRPLDSATNIDAAFVVNGSYAIVGNAFGEGTGLPTGRMRRITKYTNNFQIVKTGGGVTGSEMSNSLFVNFIPDSPDGNSVFGVMNEMYWEDFERKTALTLLNGQAINNITSTIFEVNTDATVKGTEGMLSWVQSSGHVHVITPATYALADFDNISRTLMHERSGHADVLCLDGDDIFRVTENLLLGQSGTDLTQFIQQKAEMYSTPVYQDDIQPFLSSDFSFYVGFKAVRKSGINYIFKQLMEFSDVNGLAAPTYNAVYSNSRLVLPMGECKDMRTNRKGFMCGYEYKARNGYSREVVVANFAGAGAAGSGVGVPLTSVDQYDRVRSGIVSEIAFHGACPNKAIWQRPTL